MKIFVLRFNKFDYDQYDAIAVTADNEEEALKIIKENHCFSDDSSQVDWFGGYEINEIKEKKIILDSFNAG